MLDFLVCASKAYRHVSAKVVACNALAHHVGYLKHSRLHMYVVYRSFTLERIGSLFDMCCNMNVKLQFCMTRQQ